jgi:hypothetical protein
MAAADKEQKRLSHKGNQETALKKHIGHRATS